MTHLISYYITIILMISVLYQLWLLYLLYHENIYVTVCVGLHKLSLCVRWFIRQHREDSIGTQWTEKGVSGVCKFREAYLRSQKDQVQCLWHVHYPKGLQTNPQITKVIKRIIRIKRIICISGISDIICIICDNMYK